MNVHPPATTLAADVMQSISGVTVENPNNPRRPITLLGERLDRLRDVAKQCPFGVVALRDHDGVLSVHWGSLPKIDDVTVIAQAWCDQNEYLIEHYLNDQPLSHIREDRRPVVAWPHPDDEPSRVAELEGFLAKDFDTFREVSVGHAEGRGRIDLLAVPRLCELDVALAFEVKREGFDVERSLKQSADYVGATVLDGPHQGKRIAACFLYPVPNADDGVFNVLAQWRVGRGYVSSKGEMTLAIGYEIIWQSERGWRETKADRMLLGQRTVGGSRRDGPVEVTLLKLEDVIDIERPKMTRRIG